jgi:hypothetical protein
LVSQAATARSVYAREIVGKASKDGFGERQFGRDAWSCAFAQFLKMVGKASSKNADRLYDTAISRWNLEPTQG